MTRQGREWRAFVLTRLVGVGVDTLVMLVAFVLAFAVRVEFREPSFGWRATVLCFVFTWMVQMSSLIVTGCYRIPWRRIRPLDLPRYVGAALLSGGVLTVLRLVFNEGRHAWLRPPYSVTLMNGVLFCVGVVMVRVVWRYYMVARAREQSLLLNRPERLPNAEASVELLRNRTVLVTGAGGSIGSELVRQAMTAGPKRIVMAERSELALYQIDREVRALGTSTPCVPLLVDVADAARMRHVFETWKPEVVLHAAAYKHVPLVEANPREGLVNNTVATRRLGELAAEFGVKRFVMISTDKAVNPVSAMGVTKRLAEILLMDLQRPTGTVFSAVRFGNVLGSSGSVVPLFREQIEKRGPVTVTHPEMRRYFMTIPEAVSLVLQAATFAKGGEIFTLDMGESVRVLDLAERMIREAGFRPYVDVPIVFTGIRPGEKLFEELDISERSVFKTGHARIFRCKTGDVDVAAVQAEIAAALAEDLSAEEVLARLLALKDR